MRKYKKTSVIIILFVIILTMFCIMWNLSLVGISGKKIESTVRKDQNISEDWLVKKNVKSGIGVLLFYNENLTNYIYSIYKKNDGCFSYGYFFVSSGTSSSIDSEIITNDIVIDGIGEISINDRGKTLLSFNKKNIKEIILSGKDGEYSIEINSKEPFAIVVPKNNQIIRLYDENNNDVNLNEIVPLN